MVTSTGSALALLGLYLLSCHFVSTVRDRHHDGPATEDEEHTSFHSGPLKSAISSADQ